MRKLERRAFDVALIGCVFIAAPHQTNAAVRKHSNVAELLVHQRRIGNLEEPVGDQVVDEDVSWVDHGGTALESDNVARDARVALVAWDLQLYLGSSIDWTPENVRPRRRRP